MPREFDLPWALLRKLRSMPGRDDAEAQDTYSQALASLEKLENRYINLRYENTKLRAACKAAHDLLIRCDGETRQNDLPPATGDDWDLVVVHLEEALTSPAARVAAARSGA